MPLALGDTIAGYTVIRELGVGGMGAVYLVRHPRLPRLVALKLLRAEFAADPGFAARFLHEAEMVASLSHRNIVEVFDRDEDDGRLWLTMQYVDGVDAETALEQAGGSFPAERAVHIVSEVAAALDHAHEHHILHRDVKPANILLASGHGDDPESVFLTDFGVAKALDGSTKLTKTGVVIATFDYASPEQIESAPLDARSDVYSLGGVLHRLLSGSVPYPGVTLAAAIHGHLSRPPPRPTDLVPWLPPAFDAVVAQAMAKDPADRYPTCRALAVAAARAVADFPEPPPLPYRLTLVRSGGDGAPSVVGPLSTTQISGGDAERLVDLVRRSRLFDLPERLDGDVPDAAARLTIEITSGERAHTVTIAPAARRPPTVDELVSIVDRLATPTDDVPVHSGGRAPPTVIVDSWAAQDGGPVGPRSDETGVGRPTAEAAAPAPTGIPPPRAPEDDAFPAESDGMPVPGNADASSAAGEAATTTTGDEPDTSAPPRADRAVRRRGSPPLSRRGGVLVAIITAVVLTAAVVAFVLAGRGGPDRIGELTAEAAVSSVAFSPDGTMLASGDEAGVQLWNVADLEQIGDPLTGHDDAVTSVAFSPDGKTLASGGRDGDVRLWDVATRQEIGEPLDSESDHVWSVAFRPGGATVAGGSGGLSGGTIRLWDVATGQPIGQPFGFQAGYVGSVVFSPDGTTLAASGSGSTIQFWDVATQHQIGAALDPESDNARLAYSPDGKTLVSAGGSIQFWDVATLQQIGDPLDPETEVVTSVAFSPDGRTLASGGVDAVVRLWDVATRKQLGDPLDGHDQQVTSVAFSSDRRTFASSGDGPTINVWNLENYGR